MSENISLPAARVPMVDDKGMITREWLTLLAGMFRRVGGPVGFSNSELYGDAVALQSYDELLERISSLEAQNRNLGQVVQMMALGGWDQMTATPPLAITPDTFARLKVLGETDLAVTGGSVRAGAGVAGSTAKLQVGGDLDVSAGARIRGNATVDGNASSGGTSTAAAFHVGGVKVVGARAAGVAAYTAYAGQTVAATYTQSQAQATDNAIKDASTKLAQVVTALRTHGLIGD
jgi:hypothetical protein